MTTGSIVAAIVRRDLTRWSRQGSRLVAGLGRPFVWVLLVGVGFDAIARLEGGLPYHAYVFPGGVVMAALFGGMLTGISTVYDREFGMLRLMLASPGGVVPVLLGRAASALGVGALQALVVLAVAPLFVPLTAGQWLLAAGAAVAASGASAALGLLVASRLTSVENFGGVINVLLFPMLFLSGAMYPVTGLPLPLRVAALLNPVTYQVDLLRGAMGQPAAFHPALALGVIGATATAALALAALGFDPERRILRRAARG